MGEKTEYCRKSQAVLKRTAKYKVYNIDPFAVERHILVRRVAIFTQNEVMEGDSLR